ncbi:MAG: hypothetical protein QG617_810 [Campylobacterota bacterium]|nr:hypothetical protein [Campylobacterota bacterium]
MKKLVVLIFTVAIMSGCASQIMKSYIGKDVREAIVDHGAPANAFDMGDGRRAFQWTIGHSYTMPVTATTSGSVNTYGSNSFVNSNTVITGGQTINSKCVYTLFGRWNGEKQGWFITDIKKPNLMCE